MKLNKFQFLFFSGFLIIGSSSLLSSNMMMQLFPGSAYLIPIFILPLLIILLYIIPIKISSKKIINSFVFKIIFLLYIFISSYLFVISYLKVTNDYFYNLTPPLIILIILLFLSLFISLYSLKDIFKIGFIISFISICAFSLILLNSIEYDFSLITHSINLEYNYLFLLSFIYIYLDIIINFIFISDLKIKKKNYLVLFIIVIIINSFLVLKNYLFFSYEFFIQTKFPYIYKYLVYSNKSFFEHLDILYLIFITIFFIFKMAINIENSRIILKIKKNSPLILIFIIILIISSLISNLFDIDILIISYLMICASLLIVTLFIIIKIKDCWRKHE